jgi:arylsulfatase A-like enzyme
MKYYVLKLIAFLCLFSSCTPVKQDALPNIVIINVDDMGWLDTGFQGSEFYHTPNMDNLAANGLSFSNGYASASNCAPSRACLMTGLWTPRHGIYTVGSSERGQSRYRRIIPKENNTILGEQFMLLPEILKEHGYTTIHAGKWHLSDDPRQHGFDHNLGGAHNGHPSSYFYPFGNVDLEAGAGEHLTDRIMNGVTELLPHSTRPFFLYYAPYAVHTPIQGIQRLKERYLGKQSWKGQHNIDYATMIENLDLNIGKLINTLEEMGVKDQTLIVFTSDNGGLYGITYQPPLRAGKGSYYEGGIRVPYCFTWPGRIAPGTQDTPITNLDIFPTVLEAAGVNLNDYQYDGTSLVPLLTGAGKLENRALYWHFPVYLQAYNASHNQNRDSLFRTRPGSAIRVGDWKLHHYYEDDGVELYNLKEDIGEQKNLVQSNPEKLDELYQLLDHWREQVGAPIPMTPNPEFEPPDQKILN